MMSLSGDWVVCLLRTGREHWQAALKELREIIAPAFGRREQHQSASAFIDGVLSGAERKTGWMLAEEAGFERPYRIQSLLGRSPGRPMSFAAW